MGDTGAELELRPDGAVEPAVLHGEIVEDEPRPVVVRVVAVVVRQPVHLVATLRESERAKRAGERAKALPRDVARAGWTTGQGWLSWTRRAGQALTHGHLREQVRLARLAGNSQALAEWTERLDAARDHRATRLQELPTTLWGVLFAALIAVGVLVSLALVGGVAAWAWPGGMGWVEWWGAVGSVLSTVVAVLTAALVFATWAGPVALLAGGWREGQRVANPPLWLLAPDDRARRGEAITPTIVVVALRDLGIAPLTKAIKEMGDAGAAMLSPIAIAGCGVEVDVTLPSGVSTAEVQARHRKLAENLTRHEHEVFVTIPPAPRTVRLWIADSGALDEPIGPSPLVLDDSLTADVYGGRAPWGETLRSDSAAIALLQRHVLVTGLSNQGKTAALRALALWLALDAVVEFRLADLKGLGDWHMFDGLAEPLIEGPTDEHVIEATHMLEGGVEEMERRIGALDKDKYPNGVTRELARQKGSGFHPLFLIVDEAQVAFMCPAVGPDKRPYGGSKNTSRYFMAARKLLNQGRGVNVHLWQGTQDPTDQNLPVLVREAAHIRAALALGTESQSRMALGDKAVNGGAAPHLLRQGLDKGTLVVTGDGVDLPAGQAATTIRTHYVDGEAATAITSRAIALRGERRPTVSLEKPRPAQVDHLVNVRAVLGDEPRLRTTRVIGLLGELDARTYEDWTHGDLARELAAEGVTVRKFDGLKVVRTDDVERALDSRGTRALAAHHRDRDVPPS